MSDAALNLTRCLSTEFELKTEIIAPVPTKSFSFKAELWTDFDPSQALKQEQQYKTELSSFVFTRRSEVMCIRILNSSQSAFNSYPLLKLLLEICSELLMSEVEVAGLSIYLERFVWPIHSTSLVVLLYAVGLAVKFYFSVKIDHILCHLCKKIPGFYNFFDSWFRKNEGLLMIHLPELCENFERLTRVPFDDVFLRNDFLVDSIIESAPASVYEKKWWQFELFQANDLAVPELPGMVKLDSIFTEGGFPCIQRSISVGSNQSAFNHYLEDG